VDFLNEAYTENLSQQFIRKFFRRQYETAWKAFISFVRSTKPEEIDDEVVLSFMKSCDSSNL